MLVLNKEQRPSAYYQNFTTAFGLLFLFPETLFPLKRGTEGVLERRRLLACSLAQMERPQGYWNRAAGSTWNARRVIGTPQA